MRIIRVLPRRTSYTPTDPMAFVGAPPLWRPEADEVHISCTFTWQKERAQELAQAWRQFYPVVKVDGPAFGHAGFEFTPGLYVKQGATFTSRGCNNRCPWCLVPEREGRIRLLPIAPGHIVQDNNLLQTGREHMAQVFAMLRSQRHAGKFVGGFQADLVDDWVAEELRGLRIEEVWLAADHDGALRPLEKAVKRLSFLPRDKLRCYVLLAYGGDTLAQGEARLRRVYEIGCLPFGQLYQPADKYIEYSHEWRSFARTWSRPAAMKTVMKGV